MASENELSAVLRRYVELEETTLSKLATEVANLPSPADINRREARERILRAVELHAHADALVEEAVAKYREDLYFVARRLAEDELETGIVTRAHVRQAQAQLARRRRTYGWGDALLTIGSLFVGAVIPHVIDMMQRAVQPSVPLVVGGIVGALLLGMGVVDKAKQ